MSDSSTEQDRIEQDLKHTRARMDSRLFDLGERLTPGRIVDDLMVYFRGSEGGAFARNLMASVSSNPMPAALTGIGLAWLMTTNPRPPADANADVDAGHTDRARRLHLAEGGVVRATGETDAAFRTRLDGARAEALELTRHEDESDTSFAQRIQDGIASARQAVTDAVSNGASKIGDKASELAGQAGGAAKDAASSAGRAVAQGGQSAGTVAGNLVSALGDNPVLLGVLGLAAGALLGALVPQSETERQALDGMADSLRDKAGDAAQSVVDRGEAVAKQTVSAVWQEAETQGLTADTSVGDLVRGVQSGALLDGAKQVASSGLQAGNEAAKGSSQDQPTT